MPTYISLELTPEQETRLRALGEQFTSELERAETTFPNANTVKELRLALKEVLDAQQGFAQLYDNATVKHDANLLCIAHPDAAIRNLPWQLATQDRPYLAVVKTLAPKLDQFEPAANYPLKVLIMVSAPSGANPLSFEEEELRLLTAFTPLMSKGLVQVHFTDDGSLQNLHEKLQANKYHILHYIGHGVYEDEEGALALEDPMTGQLKMANAKTVNAVFQDVHQQGHRPDLVVLSACQTAQGDPATPLAGVADALAIGGVPAVVAMSASILDNTATHFAAELYEAIAREYTLSAAFQKARVAVHEFELQKYGQYFGDELAPGQWLIPQLVLGQQVGKLITARAANAKTELDFSQELQYIQGQEGLLMLRGRTDKYLFVGRRQEKREAFAQLQAGGAVLLRGQGGVGKTALAEHLAIRMLVAHTQLKVFATDENDHTGEGLLKQLEHHVKRDLQEYGISKAVKDQETIEEKLIVLLQAAGKTFRPLFIFDNVESFQTFDAATQRHQWDVSKYEGVRVLLDFLVQTKFPVLVTGRFPVAGIERAQTVDMNAARFPDFLKKSWQLSFHKLAGPLAKGNGVLKRVGQKGTTFTDLVQLLYKTLGGNYRALDFFDELYQKDATAIERTIGKLAELEKMLRNGTKEKSVVERMGENLVFAELVSRLDAVALDTLQVLAHFEIPVLPMAVAQQREEQDRTKVFNRLADLTLIERQVGTDDHTRYYVMPLVKQLLEGLEKEGTLSAIEFDALAAGNYHQYVLDKDLELDSLVELGAAFAWFELAGVIPEVNSTGRRLVQYFYRAQQFEVARGIGERAEVVSGRDTDGHICNLLGLIAHVHGRYDAALTYFERSLVDDQQRGDRAGEGATLNNISQIYDARGDYDQALDYLTQSLGIRQEIGDRAGEGTTLNNISGFYRARGDYDQALEYLTQSLGIQQEIGDRAGEGTTLNNISQIYKARGDYDQALGYLTQSLGIRQEIGDRAGEGTTLNNISGIYRARGDYDQALEYLTQSLGIQQEIGDRAGEGTTLNNISQIYKARGDYDQADDYLTQSLGIRQEIGDRAGEGTTLNNISQIYKARGDYDQALEYLTQSLGIRQEIGDRAGEGATLSNIGATYYDLERYEEALPLLLQAYVVLESLGSPNAQYPMNYLSLIQQKLGEARYNALVEAHQNAQQP